MSDSIERKIQKLNDQRRKKAAAIDKALGGPVLRAIQKQTQPLRLLEAQIDPLGLNLIEGRHDASPKPPSSQPQRPEAGPRVVFRESVSTPQQRQERQDQPEIDHITKSFAIPHHVYTCYSQDRKILKIGRAHRKVEKTRSRYWSQKVDGARFILSGHRFELDPVVAEMSVKHYLRNCGIKPLVIDGKQTDEYFPYAEALEALRRYEAWPLGELTNAPDIEGIPYQPGIFD